MVSENAHCCACRRYWAGVTPSIFWKIREKVRELVKPAPTAISFHAPAVARHQQLGTGVVHPVAVDVFLERDVQLVLMEVERYFSLVPRARTRSCRLKFG